ncbi:MAG: hypothetical protein DI527_23440 [Chelatococcus sp.]|nr:MAG: hypothetical protein DI527_23440 [Chelatococcus sp.]
MATAAGLGCKAMASDEGVIHLVERINDFGSLDHGKPIATFSSIVGQNGIKPNTYYVLKDGKPAEAEG